MFAMICASCGPCGTLQLYCVAARAELYCALDASVGGTPYCVSANCMISDHTGAADAPPNWYVGLFSLSTTIAAKRG